MDSRMTKKWKDLYDKIPEERREKIETQRKKEDIKELEGMVPKDCKHKRIEHKTVENTNSVEIHTHCLDCGSWLSTISYTLSEWKKKERIKLWKKKFGSL